MHVELHTHTGLGACVGSKNARVCRVSASLLCFLGDEMVLSSFMDLGYLVYHSITTLWCTKKAVNGFLSSEKYGCLV